MTKLIVVEDEERIRSIIKTVIRKVLFKCDADAEVLTFSKYSKELKEIIDDNSQRKIYILDIQLETTVSGIQIAKEIRKNDWDSEIIIITSHSDMLEEAYISLYKIFRFVKKYHEFENTLFKDLKLIINKKHDNGMFKYSNKRITLQLYYRDITYITRDTAERKLIIYTTHNCFYLSLNMSDIEKKLDSRFKKVHRACIANTDRVTKYDWAKGQFHLDNNEIVPLLSKKYKGGI